MTLLFVEDPKICLDFQKRLGSRGIKVVNVSSGAVALEMIRSLNPALIILGYELQDLPGDEVARRIKKNPVTRNIPVIILYDPSRGPVDKTFEALCDEALCKPVDAEVLMKKISERLNVPYRRHNRIAIDIGVNCARQDDVVKGFARNISEGGVFVETDAPLDIGSNLTLSLTLPGQQSALVVPGAVVRRIELAREFRFGLGIQFTGLTPGSRERLLDFLVHKSLQVTA